MNNLTKTFASVSLAGLVMLGSSLTPYQPVHTVSINIDQVERTQKTKHTLVEDVLREAGVILRAEDEVNKDPKAAIVSGDRLIVKRAVPIHVVDSGTRKTMYTTQKTVREALAKAGIHRERADRLNLPENTPVRAEQTILISRVTYREETKREKIPFDVIQKEDKDLLKGTKRLAQPGRDGELKVTRRITLVDGKEEASEVIQSEVTRAMHHEITKVGTKVEAPKPIPVAKEKTTSRAKPVRTSEQDRPAVSSSKAESQGSFQKTFTLSFYTDLPEENGGWSITATGERLRYGMVASNYYAIGTTIHLEGWGDFVVKDRGGSNFNNSYRLDVFIPRRSGESSSAYLRRVNNMGMPRVRGSVY
ncbi:hypothetical protein ABB02_00038 [Clostridiaceae bacterium JG1575]|nr:hypothetical protein ABB02_00038 [Clostridiaceae bacterium JG1575]